MTDPVQADTPRRPYPPIINAPFLVIATAVALVLLHLAFVLAAYPEQIAVTYDYALAPQRFWAPAGSRDVYPDVLSGLLTLLSSGLLHADWLHVLVNAAMLLAVGAPVARALGDSPAGVARWMLLLVVAIVGGSALYLAFANVDSAYLIGASGGVSGLIGAVFLLDPRGGKRALWSRQFLTLTIAFILVNALMVLVSPFMLGIGVSWEAHLGGYVAGALMMAILPVRGYPGPGGVRAES